MQKINVLIPLLENEEELKEFLIRSYYAQRKISYPYPNISRGRQASISSISEDAFAVYITSVIEKEFKPEKDSYFIWVDKQLNCPKGGITKEGEKEGWRPDVSVFRNIDSSTVRLLFAFDLKMDLGFCRKEDEFKQFCKKRHDFINKIISGDKNVELEGKTVISSKSLTYEIVVLNSRNGGNWVAKKSISKDFDKVNATLLVEEKSPHMNNSEMTPDELLTNIVLNEQGIRNLTNRIIGGFSVKC